MNGQPAVLRDAFETALAEREETYDRSRKAAKARRAAQAALPAPPSRAQELVDAAAKVVAAQYRVPVEDVMVNGRLYGDIVAERALVANGGLHHG